MKIRRWYEVWKISVQPVHCKILVAAKANGVFHYRMLKNMMKTIQSLRHAWANSATGTWNIELKLHGFSVTEERSKFVLEIQVCNDLHQKVISINTRFFDSNFGLVWKNRNNSEKLLLIASKIVRCARTLCSTQRDRSNVIICLQERLQWVFRTMCSRLVTKAF